MLNKALLLASAKEAAEPTLTVKWSGVERTSDYSVGIQLNLVSGSEWIDLIDVSFPSGEVEVPLSEFYDAWSSPYTEDFFIYNSKMSYNYSLYPQVTNAENVEYVEEISGYDDYIRCRVSDLSKSALLEFNMAS